jgi:hypothetical protein
MRKLLVLAIASCSSEPPRAEPVEAGGVCEADRASMLRPEVPSEWLRMDVEDGLRPFAVTGICGTPAAATPGAATLHAAALGDVTPHSATAEPATPDPVRTGIHGLPITVLAATEDGSVAATADAAGAVRLWPALDGTREPVVVAAHPPLALAVMRTDGEIAIAGLDAAGHLEIVRTTAAGLPVGRAVVDSQRAAASPGASDATRIARDRPRRRRRHASRRSDPRATTARSACGGDSRERLTRSAIARSMAQRSRWRSVCTGWPDSR